MSWISGFKSVGGILQGAISFIDIPDSFVLVGAYVYPYYSYFGYGTFAGYTPIDYSSVGIDLTQHSAPLEIARFVTEDGALIRRYIPDSSTIEWQVSTDGGTTWSTLAQYADPSLMTKVIVPMAYTNGTNVQYDLLAIQSGANVYGSIPFMGIDWELAAEDYGEVETEEISPEYGEASGPGGYDGGTFDDSSDTIGIPTMPSIGVSSIGFVNVYNPSTGALAQLGEELFPDFTPISPYSPTGNTVIDAITDVAEALANIASNIPNVIAMYSNAQLINYIIDCHIIPVTPTVGSSQAIKIGYRTMSQAAPKVSSDYVDCDCGSINIGEYYRNFIDYGPYTQAKLFLPFVGFVPIEPELFQSGVLKVVYRFNVIDGSFMAFVLSTSSKSKLSNSVIGQWGGNACVHVPITGINYSNMVSGIAAGASAVVAEIGKGSLIGTADAALNTAAAAPALQSSNGYNATTSFLSVRTPYLMIERSVSHYSKDYGHEQGYPSEITADWSTLSGYTESDAIHLEGLGATEEEMKEIASLLAAGVIL